MCIGTSSLSFTVNRDLIKSDIDCFEGFILRCWVTYLLTYVLTYIIAGLLLFQDGFYLSLSSLVKHQIGHAAFKI